VPKEWNVLVISHEHEERRLLKALKGLGEFEFTGFRSLLVGKVDPRAFLEKIQLMSIASLSRVVPIEENFNARPDNLLQILKERVKEYAKRIEPGESFCLRFERRGFKGEISSQEIEREVGEYMYGLLEREGKNPRVDLEDPDKLVVVQSIGDSFGMGLIDRETMERYPFIRVK
jgi:tRNA(Ser,Leu) C12 N-acetylase TAN1